MTAPSIIATIPDRIWAGQLEDILDWLANDETRTVTVSLSTGKTGAYINIQCEDRTDALQLAEILSAEPAPHQFASDAAIWQSWKHDGTYDQGGTVDVHIIGAARRAGRI